MQGLAAGGQHTCALDASGGVWCWGNDQSGQLGDDGAVDSAVPVRVASLASGATALAAGTAHTCALVGGRVRCWGWNVAGQLGDGTEEDRATPVWALGF
jgi:alpha-tubulin suppressor-like RCC1 family protein